MTKLPAEMIMFDETCTHAPFYLRIESGSGVDMIDLSAATLPLAIDESRSKGYKPSHWMSIKSSIPMLITRR